MENKSIVSFEKIFEQNKRRINYHIRKLDQENIYISLHAYKTYQPGKGIFSTYFNCTIRHLLIALQEEKLQHHILAKQNLEALHLKIEREQDPLTREMLQSELNMQQWKLMCCDIGEKHVT